MNRHPQFGVHIKDPDQCGRGSHISQFNTGIHSLQVKITAYIDLETAIIFYTSYTCGFVDIDIITGTI